MFVINRQLNENGIINSIRLSFVAYSALTRKIILDTFSTKSIPSASISLHLKQVKVKEKLLKFAYKLIADQNANHWQNQNYILFTFDWWQFWYSGRNTIHSPIYSTAKQKSMKEGKKKKKSLSTTIWNRSQQNFLEILFPCYRIVGPIKKKKRRTIERTKKEAEIIDLNDMEWKQSKIWAT